MIPSVRFFPFEDFLQTGSKFSPMTAGISMINNGRESYNRNRTFQNRHLFFGQTDRNPSIVIAKDHPPVSFIYISITQALLHRWQFLAVSRAWMRQSFS